MVEHLKQKLYHPTTFIKWKELKKNSWNMLKTLFENRSEDHTASNLCMALTIQQTLYLKVKLDHYTKIMGKSNRQYQKLKEKIKQYEITSGRDLTQITFQELNNIFPDNESITQRRQKMMDTQLKTVTNIYEKLGFGTESIDNWKVETKRLFNGVSILLNNIILDDPTLIYYLPELPGDGDNLKYYIICYHKQSTTKGYEYFHLGTCALPAGNQSVFTIEESVNYGELDSLFTNYLLKHRKLNMEKLTELRQKSEYLQKNVNHYEKFYKEEFKFKQGAIIAQYYRTDLEDDYYDESSSARRPPLGGPFSPRGASAGPRPPAGPPPPQHALPPGPRQPENPYLEGLIQGQRGFTAAPILTPSLAPPPPQPYVRDFASRVPVRQEHPLFEPALARSSPMDVGQDAGPGSSATLVFQDGGGHWKIYPINKTDVDSINEAWVEEQENLSRVKTELKEQSEMITDEMYSEHMEKSIIKYGKNLIDKFTTLWEDHAKASEFETFSMFMLSFVTKITIETFTELIIGKGDEEWLPNGKLDEFNTLEGGMKGRKDALEELSRIIVDFAQDSRNNFKIGSKGRFLNYLIMGPAGSGKTTMANILSNLFNYLGVLLTNNMNTITRKDIVGQYIGQTAPLTRNMLIKQTEGILFIDEAYQLAGCEEYRKGHFKPTKGKDFGQEAITEIVNYLDKNIGTIIVIAAGYERETLECFVKSNEGMNRRFPNRIILKKMEPVNLTKILLKNIIDITPDIDPEQITEDKRFFRYLVYLVTIFNNLNLLPNGPGDMQNLATKITSTIGQMTPAKINTNLEAYNSKDSKVQMVDLTLLASQGFVNFLKNRSILGNIELVKFKDNIIETMILETKDNIFEEVWKSANHNDIHKELNLTDETIGAISHKFTELSKKVYIVLNDKYNKNNINNFANMNYFIGVLYNFMNGNCIPKCHSKIDIKPFYELLNYGGKYNDIIKELQQISTQLPDDDDDDLGGGMRNIKHSLKKRNKKYSKIKKKNNKKYSKTKKRNNKKILRGDKKHSKRKVIKVKKL